MRGETRFVTVLAATLREREVLLESLDPDEVDAAVRILTRELGEVAARFGASHEASASCLVATFGLVKTTEDDAGRAIATACEMQAVADRFSLNLANQAGTGLKLAIGLHTGRLATGPLREQGEVDGPVVEHARSLAAQASSGAIVASDDVFRALHDRYEFRLHGDPDVARAHRRYKVLGPRIRSTYAARIEEPLIGRVEELRRIDLALEVVYGGSPAVIVIQGPPGIGKTRLSRETVRRFTARGGLVVDATYVESPGGSRILGVVSSLLQSPPDVARLASGLARAGIQDAAREASLLADLLGIPNAGALAEMAPLVKRERAFASLTRWMGAICRRQPILLVAGDSRGADELFEGWLQFSIARQVEPSENLPALGILAECRSDRPWRLPDCDRVVKSVLELGQMTLPDCTALVAEALGLPPASDLWPPAVTELSQNLHQRAEGNPLFIESLVRTFEAEGTFVREPGGKLGRIRIPQQFELPATLGLMVASLLDSLPDELRQVVDIATVLGRRFEYRLLDAVAGMESLDRAVEKLLAARLLVQEGPETLAFAQQSILEVAAETQPPDLRETLNARAGVALERLAEQAGFDASDRLAAHFLAAGKGQRAVKYLVRAGEAARRCSRNETAKRLLGTALKISRSEGSGGGSQSRILMALAEVEGALGNKDVAIACWRDLTAIGTPQDQVRAFCELGRYHENPLADFRSAQTFLELGLAKARAIGDLGGEAGILVSFATVSLRVGNFREAAHLCDRVLASHPDAAIGHDGDLRSVRGAALLRLRQYDAAIEELRKSLEIRLAAKTEAGMLDGLDALTESSERDARLDDAILRGVNTLGAAYLEAGRLQEAETTLRRALAFARRVPALDRTAMVLNNLGDLQMRRGNYDLAMKHFEDVAAAQHQAENERGECIALANLGEASGRRGDSGRAIESLEMACSKAETLGYRELLPEMLRLLADAHDLAGHANQSDAIRQKATDIENEDTG